MVQHMNGEKKEVEYTVQDIDTSVLTDDDVHNYNDCVHEKHKDEEDGFVQVIEFDEGRKG